MSQSPMVTGVTYVWKSRTKNNWYLDKQFNNYLCQKLTSRVVVIMIELVIMIKPLAHENCMTDVWHSWTLRMVKQAKESESLEHLSSFKSLQSISRFEGGDARRCRVIMSNKTNCTTLYWFKSIWKKGLMRAPNTIGKLCMLNVQPHEKQAGHFDWRNPGNR